MKVNLSIKGVPAELVRRLRERAARNCRSLQRELMAIIEDAAREPLPPALARVPNSVRPRDLTVFRRGSRTIDEVVGRIRRRYPVPVRDAPLAVDIVRAMRDAR